jgi:hypothetical protein
MRKTVVSLLSKLYLPDEVETTPLQGMIVLIRNIASVSHPDSRLGSVQLILVCVDSDDPFKTHCPVMPSLGSKSHSLSNTQISSKEISMSKRSVRRKGWIRCGRSLTECA